MKIRVAEIEPYGAVIVVAVVDSSHTLPGTGDVLLERLRPYFPTHPIMLVSVEPNGFRAHAPFQTHRLLALLQLEFLDLKELDLNTPPPEKDEELPF